MKFRTPRPRPFVNLLEPESGMEDPAENAAGRQYHGTWTKAQKTKANPRKQNPTTNIRTHPRSKTLINITKENTNTLEDTQKTKLTPKYPGPTSPIVNSRVSVTIR